MAKKSMQPGKKKKCETHTTFLFLRFFIRILVFLGHAIALKVGPTLCHNCPNEFS